MSQVTTTTQTLLHANFPAEFTQGAQSAIKTCLRVQPEEKVTLITDEATLAIAASLATELEEIGAQWNAFKLEDIATPAVERHASRSTRGHGDQPREHLCRAGAAE